MICLPNGIEVHFAAGAGAMSGALDNSAAANASSGWDKLAIDVADTGHGLKAGSDIFLDNIKASTTYLSNRMRNIISLPDANSLVLGLDKREAWAAVTPAGTEAWCAGYVSENPYFFLGFKLHLSAADTNGETLTLTVDSNRNTAVAYWDTLIYSKVMTGVTDIIYFPEVKIPMIGGDILKFAWTNTGAKTWGTELWVQNRV